MPPKAYGDEFPHTHCNYFFSDAVRCICRVLKQESVIWFYFVVLENAKLIQQGHAWSKYMPIIFLLL